MTSPTTTAAPPPGSCSADYNTGNQCAIVIDLDTARPAHVVTLTVPHNFALNAAGPGPAPGTLLVGGVFGTVLRLAVTDTTARRRATLHAPDRALVVGFSATGRQVLYLRNHGPVQLWTANIGTNRVTPLTELLANADLGSVSW